MAYPTLPLTHSGRILMLVRGRCACGQLPGTCGSTTEPRAHQCRAASTLAEAPQSGTQVSQGQPVRNAHAGAAQPLRILDVVRQIIQKDRPVQRHPELFGEGAKMRLLPAGVHLRVADHRRESKAAQQSPRYRICRRA
eukprot:1734959-Prymnesium_polylepis.3